MQNNLKSQFMQQPASTGESAAMPRAAGDVPHLTARQLDVLRLLCEGLPNKLISRRLGISCGTVKVHVSCVFRALNVSGRLPAAIKAQRLGLLEAAASASPEVDPEAAPVRAAAPPVAPAKAAAAMVVRALPRIVHGSRAPVFTACRELLRTVAGPR